MFAAEFIDEKNCNGQSTEVFLFFKKPIIIPSQSTIDGTPLYKYVFGDWQAPGGIQQVTTYQKQFPEVIHELGPCSQVDTKTQRKFMSATQSHGASNI